VLAFPSTKVLDAPANLIENKDRPLKREWRRLLGQSESLLAAIVANFTGGHA